MGTVPLVMICTCDLAGQVRGKALPLARLEERRRFGIGWTPTNSQITAHGPIAPSPWGAKGDTFLRPDLSTLVDLEVAADRHERFVLADIMTLEETDWFCCPRAFLRRQIDALAAHGLSLTATFEHEFAYLGDCERPNGAYALASFRQQGGFADHLLAVVDRAGLAIDTFMPEFGPSQFEITIGPRDALRAADEAVILRELVRATAAAHGRRASFSPLLRPDAVGNGVHVHFSLKDTAGRPVNHDANRPLGVAAPAAAFLEGVRRHLPALTALTAAGTISYLRLKPNRWSAVANDIGLQDREAALRICPVFTGDPERRGELFHFEYRAADACASPYVALAAIVAAGIDGLEQALDIPAAAPTRKLPQSLGEALLLLADDQPIKSAMGKTLHDLYQAHKTFEIELMRAESEAGQCARYVEAY